MPEPNKIPLTWLRSNWRQNTTFTIGTTASGATYASLDGTTDYRTAPHRTG